MDLITRSSAHQPQMENKFADFNAAANYSSDRNKHDAWNSLIGPSSPTRSNVLNDTSPEMPTGKPLSGALESPDRERDSGAAHLLNNSIFKVQTGRDSPYFKNSVQPDNLGLRDSPYSKKSVMQSDMISLNRIVSECSTDYIDSIIQGLQKSALEDHQLEVDESSNNNENTKVDNVEELIVSGNSIEKRYSESEVRESLLRQHQILTSQYEDNLKLISRMYEDSPILKVRHVLRTTKLSEILCHEEILPERVEQFYQYVMSYGINNPICIPAIIVDMNTMVIIDGHHRYYTLLRLGLQEVEVLFVDYQHKDIIIQSVMNITKEDVIQAAKSGKLLRPKLSRHLVNQCGKLVPILCMSTIISFVLKIVLHQI
jgi:hypothetical protein